MKIGGGRVCAGRPVWCARRTAYFPVSPHAPVGRRAGGKACEGISDSLIEAEWIEAAQKRSLPRTRKPHLGIDIARFGDDESVIMQREGGWVRAAWVGGKLSTMVTTGHIVRIKNKLGSRTGRSTSTP